MTAKTRAMAAAVVVGIAMVWAASGFAASYQYTAGGVDVNDWSDPANWSGGTTFPGDASNIGDDSATIPDGFGPSFFNVSAQVFALTTGDTPVSFPGGLSVGGASNATITVGSGGASFTGNILFPNASGKIIANGDLTANATQFANGGHSITQNAGVFDIGSFSLRDFPIVAWDFATAKPLVFSGTNNGTYTFAETPVFSAGHRPDWLMSAGGADVKWDLNGKNLLGDDIKLQGHPSLNRHSYLFNDITGGTIDANTISLDASNNSNYLDLSDTNVIIRGSGLAWNMDSIRNTAFDITNNTTVTFDPDGGALSINTGSFDYGTAMGEGSYLLGNEDNFAFDEIILGAGDTITLDGLSTWGGGPTALYAMTLTGSASTLVLNGHNVYLFNQPTGVTFDTTGGGGVFVVPEPASGVLLLVLAAAILPRRKQCR